MKAQSLKKVPVSIESIHQQISEANSRGEFRWFIPHFVYVTEEVKIQLIEEGFKVYKADWDGLLTDCLIVEW